MNEKNEIPENCFVMGNKLMGRCWYCNKIVRIDKPILGSMHVCLTDEECKLKDRGLEQGFVGGE